MAASGSEGPPQPDLGTALDDAEQGGVGDGDGADQESEPREGVEERLDVALHLETKRLRVRWDERLEPLGALRAQGEGGLAVDELELGGSVASRQ